MFSLDVFLSCLLVASTVTGFATEAIKKIMTEYNKTYRANTLAGIVAIVVSALVGVGYIVVFNAGFTSQNIVAMIGLAISSWLCAMVGYDKVIQAIQQFKK